MTSTNQSKYWTQTSSAYQKQRYTTDSYDEEQTFVQVRRSRKGTQLNLPEEFYRKNIEQPFIKKIPILPAGGCCDMEYVMHRQNALKREISTQNNVYYAEGPRYSPSLTINIQTTQPFNNTQHHRVCEQNRSCSTISINPTVLSEEPWLQKKNVIPLGLYCCGQPSCQHVQSVEQKVVELDVAEPVDEKGFVYVTKPPTISPLKACWKFLTCTKKPKPAETYMPSVMTKAEPKDCRICPKCSKTEVRSSDLLTNRNNPAYALHSRLSTITESERTVSEYSSEEFVSQENKEKKEKEKKKFEYPQRTYTGTGKTLEDGSIYSKMNSPTFFHPDGIHRWVCKPVDHKKRFFNILANKQYICYKESLE